MKTTGNLTKNEAPVIALNDDHLRNHVAEVVRLSVEETLNSLLAEEVDGLCEAEKYECSIKRVSTRAANYKRSFQTTSGMP